MQSNDVRMRELLQIFHFSDRIHGQAILPFSGVDFDLLNSNKVLRIRSEMTQIDYGVGPFTELLVWSESKSKKEALGRSKVPLTYFNFVSSLSRSASSGPLSCERR